VNRHFFVMGLPLLLAPLACGAGDAARPEAPTATSATGRNACGKTGTSTLEPLVVDMQPEKRADLEAALREGRGLVTVRYTCDELVVIRDCRVRGAYAERLVSPKTQVTTMKSADEVRATLPVGATHLVAAQGGFARGSSIDLELTMAGMLEARDGAFDPGALDGPCERVTHVIQSATFGAFQLTRASHGSVDGEVAAMGASTKASSSDDKKTLAKEGSAPACDGATSSLPRGCDAVLRLVLAPVGAQLPPVDLRAQRGLIARMNPCQDGMDKCQDRCRARDARACFEVGSLLGSADGAAYEPIGAARALQRGCQLNHAGACLLLGLNYLTAGNPVADPEMGRSFCDRACKLGNPQGCYSLYESYKNQGDRQRAAEALNKGCYLDDKKSESARRLCR
jgi:hypothetical protein